MAPLKCQGRLPGARASTCKGPGSSGSTVFHDARGMTTSLSRSSSPSTAWPTWSSTFDSRVARSLARSSAIRSRSCSPARRAAVATSRNSAQALALLPAKS